MWETDGCVAQAYFRFSVKKDVVIALPKAFMPDA